MRARTGRARGAWPAIGPVGRDRGSGHLPAKASGNLKLFLRLFTLTANGWCALFAYL